MFWKNCFAKNPFFFPSDQVFSFEKTSEEEHLKIEDVTTMYDNETLSLSIKAKNIEYIDNNLNIEPKGYLQIVQRHDMDQLMDLSKLMPNRYECVEQAVLFLFSSCGSIISV
jgi:hypothetical protein